MKILSIHGPDDSLLSPKKYVRFIPSIAKWKETKSHVVYMVSYRVWKPEKDPKKPVTKPSDPGHPWVTFWKMSRLDGTAFLLLEVSKRDPSDMRVVKEFSVTRNGRVDMRLVPNNNDGSFWVTYNTFGLLNPRTHAKNHARVKDTAFQPTCFLYKNPKTGRVVSDVKPRVIDANRTLTESQKELYKQQSWCTFQMKGRMTFDESTGKFTFRDTGLVCPQHHQRFEKNLQIYTDDSGRVGYQYAITPWSFFKPDDCSRLVHPYAASKTGPLFSRLVRYFDSRKDVLDMNRNVSFSCSTPLLDYTDSEYLAVGHFKIHYGSVQAKRHLSTFLNKTKALLDMPVLRYEGYEDRIHPKLIYGMFLYTVDKKTLQLRKASGGFIPLVDFYKQALSFPTGLSQHTPNQFLISYHENDMTMRLLHLSRAEINRMLTFHDNSRASDYTFKYLF